MKKYFCPKCKKNIIRTSKFEFFCPVCKKKYALEEIDLDLANLKFYYDDIMDCINDDDFDNEILEINVKKLLTYNENNKIGKLFESFLNKSDDFNTFVDFYKDFIMDDYFIPYHNIVIDFLKKKLSESEQNIIFELNSEEDNQEIDNMNSVDYDTIEEADDYSIENENENYDETLELPSSDEENDEYNESYEPTSYTDDLNTNFSETTNESFVDCNENKDINDRTETFDYLDSNNESKNIDEVESEFSNVDKDEPLNYDSDQINELGKEYFINGEYDKSFSLFNRAAELNNNKGLANLGLSYLYGKGCKIDVDKAIDNYEKSIKYGNDASIYNLALIYFDTNFDVCDIDKAIRLLKEAANKDIPEAQFKLAKCYYRGNGVKTSYSLALDWLNKAIENGSKRAIEFKNEHFKH